MKIEILKTQTSNRNPNFEPSFGRLMNCRLVRIENGSMETQKNYAKNQNTYIVWFRSPKLDRRIDRGECTGR